MKIRDFVILVGPSAVGKTTVMTALMELSGAFAFSRSMTTRAPRFVGDCEYLYVTDAEFQTAKEAGKLLEYTEYSNFAYATPISEIERISEENKHPLLILDLVGAKTLKSGNFGKNVFTVYLYDSLDVMEKRLTEREKENRENPEESEKIIKKRTSANIRDYGALVQYRDVLDAFVPNTEEPKKTAEKILSLFSKFCEGETVQSQAEKDRVIALLKAESEKKSIG